MALQKTYEYKGIPLPEAYFKIDPCIIYDYSTNKNTVYMWVYADSSARGADIILEPIKYTILEGDLIEEEGDGDYRDKFYRYFKTLPEYTDALDV